jgi:two-component system sensor histidine kinase CreC
MTQTLILAVSAVALILFVAFIGARLLRSRNAGLSIRMQIFLALATIVGSFALGLGLLVVDRVEARTTLLAEESARSEAATVAAFAADQVAVRGKTLAEVARDLGGLDDDGKVALIDEKGAEIIGPHRELDGAFVGPGVVTVTVPIRHEGRVFGAVLVRKPTIVIQNVLADFAPTILLLSVVLGAAAAGAAAIIGRTIAAPIEQLADFADRVSQGERRIVPPHGQGREVIRLTTAIDTMRRELEGRPFAEAFAADLSHELKNPVAAIRASAEVLADGALEEPAEAEKFVARIREATQRIEVLLGELLGLARIESRGVQDAEIVALRALAAEAASRARDRGAVVEVVADVEGAVRGDALWLARMLDNLLENARIHGESGPIALRLAAQGERVVVEVASRGRVEPHVHKRLFRRFVTTRADRGGSGLGLAIVRAVVEAHGGTIACAEFGPPRVVFRAELPEA